VRPMSDMPGLAAALLGQALLVRGFHDRRALIVGAVVSGLAAGFRVQALWLTTPLFIAALIAQRRAGLRWMLSRPVAGLAAAILGWLVPLMWISGGMSAYLAALGSQAGEDFSWVDMLWANPTPRRIAFALLDTFAAPWSTLPLAAVVGVAAAAGLVVTLVRDRAALAIVCLAFVPYLVGHLLFQETSHVRYALPALPLVVWLAARGIAALRPLALPATAAIAAWALVLAVPAAIVYGRDAHPAFRAIGEMRRAAEGAAPAAVHSHYALRRPLQTVDDPRLAIVAPRREYEWLGMADYWRSGGAGDIWFLADPRRKDLDSIDRDARRAVVHYPWPLADRAELGGTRPQSVDWYRLRPPNWFVTEGWALTPETGGLARARGHGIHRQPIHAFVRRRSGPIRIMVGGRYLDSGPIKPVGFTLTLDGVAIAAWRFGPDAGGLNFLRIFEVPSGVPAGDGPYARLTMTATAVDGGPVPEVAIRQFDLQPLDGLIVGFDAGWHEEEYDSATGRRWRWSSGRSALRVLTGGDVVLRLRGESPLKYFDAPPTVRVTLNGETVGTTRPTDDFDWQVTLPAAAIARAAGVVVLEQDRVYRPGVAEGTADARELGLRLFEIDVHPVAQ